LTGHHFSPENTLLERTSTICQSPMEPSLPNESGSAHVRGVTFFP
jgi:hypothetical protein